MTKPTFNIRCAAANPSHAEIDIFGIIGESWWDEETNTIQSVTDRLKEVKALEAESVTVNLNSLGGDVNHALAIYEALAALGDKLTVKISGYCASAATVIAMAAKNRLMSKYGLFLVHKCWSHTSGNENELEAELEAQRTVNATLKQLYLDRAGIDEAKLDELMEANDGKGRWLSYDEALELGFVTGTFTEASKKKAMLASAAELELLGLPSLGEKKQRSNFFKELINQLFNQKTETQTMNRQQITTLVCLAALFADGLNFDEEGHAILSQSELESIEAKLAAMQKDAEAKQSRIDELTQQNQKLTEKRDELQKLLDSHTTTNTHVDGEDPKPAGDSYAEFQKNNPYYKSIKKELGQA